MLRAEGTRHYINQAQTETHHKTQPNTMTTKLNISALIADLEALKQKMLAMQAAEAGVGVEKVEKVEKVRETSDLGKRKAEKCVNTATFGKAPRKALAVHRAKRSAPKEVGVGVGVEKEQKAQEATELGKCKAPEQEEQAEDQAESEPELHQGYGDSDSDSEAEYYKFYQSD